MTAAKKIDLLPIEEYLTGELESPVKHEYVGGVVYAMAGANNRHNLIATRILGILFDRLKGRPCQPFNSDTKIRLRLPTGIRFYYPDASVVHRPNSLHDSFQDDPIVIVEFLSRQTRRIDEGEKKDAYLMMPSLCAYLLVEQDRPKLVVHRRTEHGFVPEVHEGLDAIVPLPEIGINLPLAEIYEGAEFTPERIEEDC